MSDSDARQELLQRPSLEDETRRVTAARDEIRDALSAQLGLTRWTDQDRPGEAGCGEDLDLPGTTGSTSTLLLAGGVPDDQWAAAVQVVTDVAARHGFGAPQIVIDRPGQHDAEWPGERESRIVFGTVTNATLRLEYGCHLPAAARGGP